MLLICTLIPKNNHIRFKILNKLKLNDWLINYEFKSLTNITNYLTTVIIFYLHTNNYIGNGITQNLQFGRG